MAITTQIEQFTKTPSRQNPATFSQDMDVRLSEENSRITQMNSLSNEINQSSDDINTVAQIVEQDALQVSISKTETNKAKEDAISAKNEAVLAKDEIKGYVMPTGATYSPTTIDAKLDMAETLNLTGAI